MARGLITGVGCIGLAVPDMQRSAFFYAEVWGLQPESGGARLRAADGHVAVRLSQSGTAHLASLTLLARDAQAVDALHRRAQELGLPVLAAPARHDGTGSVELTLRGPEGLVLTIAAGVDPVPTASDRTRPHALTHVVLNTSDMPAMLRLFVDVLGFSVTDSTERMEFLRCGSDHHTIALAHGRALSLNHAAFEMHDIDSLMHGAGRLLDHGYQIEWGLGRHGPGNNVFAYFIDPDGFVVEYTTEMEQVDDGYVTHDAHYWARFPRRPCRWGVARSPSPRIARAMAGELQAC